MAADRRDRVRAPRVQITYDADTENGIERRELPFVVGVLGDFSGSRERSMEKLKERHFVEIDRSCFDDVLARMKPALTFRVANKLTNDDSNLTVELRFKNLDDFEPERVAKQIKPLRDLIEVRQRLSELRETLRKNAALRERLRSIVSDPQKLKTAAAEIGLITGAGCARVGDGNQP